VTIEPSPSNKLSAVKLFGIEYRILPMAVAILPEIAGTVTQFITCALETPC
jgi:hypothetical protein